MGHLMLTGMKKSVLEITTDLIKIPSVTNRPAAVREVFAYTEDFFKDSSGLFVKNFSCHGRPSLVVSAVDSLSPDILMIGHLDVVDAGPEMFEPRIENGRLIGRGACDMKSEDAVMMFLMKEFSEQKNPPSVALILTSDEEIGGADGLGYLVDAIGYRCRAALVPDGGSAPEELILSSKGVLHLRLSAKGVPAHGSAPWLGENALDKLIDAYQKIKKFFPDSAGSDHWHNTCNLGICSGGQAANQVPDSAHCLVDIRFTEDNNAAALAKKIRQAIPECEVEVVATGQPCFTSSDDKFVRLYNKVVQNKFSLPPCQGKNHSSHDGRYLSAHGIPILISRPISGGQHSEKEWVDLQSLKLFTDVYREFLSTIR